jgi:hypothetical protein
MESVAVSYPHKAGEPPVNTGWVLWHINIKHHKQDTGEQPFPYLYHFLFMRVFCFVLAHS